jgi:hypothetical protein
MPGPISPAIERWMEEKREAEARRRADREAQIAMFRTVVENLTLVYGDCNPATRPPTGIPQESAMKDGVWSAIRECEYVTGVNLRSRW